MTVLDPIAPPIILPEVFARWFVARGWAPRAHQLELLKRAREGKSVLLIAPTGGGKTLAGFLPTLVELSSLSLPPQAKSGVPDFAQSNAWSNSGKPELDCGGEGGSTEP